MATALLQRHATVGAADGTLGHPPAFDDIGISDISNSSTSCDPPPPFLGLQRSATSFTQISAAPNSKESFLVAGKRLTAPLVSVDAVKAHLRLLSAFNQLKKDLVAHQQPELAAAGISDEDRWTIFLVKAHTRFEAWFTSRTCEPEAYDLPMTDFLFLWYCYLVHPRAYCEDNGQTSVAKGFNVMQAANDIDPDTRRYRPVEADATKRIHYEAVIGYSLDIDLNLTPDATLSDFNNVQPVPCPACEFVEYVAYLSLEDPTKGYSHKHFSTSCRQCSLELTREVLAVGRFALTLLLYMRAKVYLNGTNLSPITGRPDGFFAATLNEGMTTQFRRVCGDCASVAEVGSRLNWKYANLARLLHSSPIGFQLPNRVSQVLTYYSQPVFSVDLVTAARRQSLFIEELEQLGWLEPSFLDNDSSVLDMAVARYHQYLDLLAVWPSRKPMIPTLDINLVMQTHQINAGNYRNSTTMILGKLPDNNIVLPQQRLLDCFEATSKAFRARFRQPYSTCGCGEKAKFGAQFKTAARSATRMEDVLAVIRSSRPRSSQPVGASTKPTLQQNAEATTLLCPGTHPCGYNMIVAASARLNAVKQGKRQVAGHRQTLLDPPEKWCKMLRSKNLYGYGLQTGQETPSLYPGENDAAVHWERASLPYSM